ncbi:MAG TPA: hypothetical protein PK771_10060 [Spirochaetota bacterium]|nr:hypothetical protein [Spirochaetota bacterium]
MTTIKILCKGFLVSIILLIVLSSCSFKTPGPTSIIGVYAYTHESRGFWSGINLIVIGVHFGYSMSGIGFYGSPLFFSFGEIKLPQIHIGLLPIIKPLLNYRGYGLNLAVISIGI